MKVYNNVIQPYTTEPSFIILTNTEYSYIVLTKISIKSASPTSKGTLYYFTYS